MVEKHEEQTKADPKGTKAAPKRDVVPEEDRVPVGRVDLRLDDEVTQRIYDPETGELKDVPLKRTINKVPTSDSGGNTVMVDADEAGHPDITTSPLK